MPNLSYIEGILCKRPHNISIIAHAKFYDKSMRLKEKFPDIEIAIRKDIHAKFVLIEPDTVWLSSANFGRSNWAETSIGMHSKEAFRFYQMVFTSLLQSAQIVRDKL